MTDEAENATGNDEVDLTEEFADLGKQSGYQPQTSSDYTSETGMVGWLIRHSRGMITTGRRARQVLLWVVLVLGMIMTFVIFSGRGELPFTDHDPNTGYGGKSLPDSFR